MRILEYRQSNTSPLKYHIELSEEEMRLFSSDDDKEVVQILKLMFEHTKKLEERN